jgi:hypothetical protein
MSYLNDLIPADTEAVKMGAQRIRELKTSLNTVLAGVFNDAGNFLSKWVTGGMVADGAIGSVALADAAVTASKLGASVLTADTAGQAKMADGYLTQAKLAAGFVLPDGSILTAALADNAVTANKLANASITLAKLAAGAARIAIGQYSGSNTSAAVVSGLPFAPSFLVLTGGGTVHEIGMAFLAEAGALHACWSTAGTAPTYSTAVTWTADGFQVTPVNFPFNLSGKTHSYLALA